MDIQGRNILILGGSGLIGIAIARKLLPLTPARIVIAALRRDEAEEGVRTLQTEGFGDDSELVAEWGDVFLRASRRDESRRELLATDEGLDGSGEIVGVADSGLDSGVDEAMLDLWMPFLQAMPSGLMKSGWDSVTSLWERLASNGRGFLLDRGETAYAVVPERVAAEIRCRPGPGRLETLAPEEFLLGVAHDDDRAGLLAEPSASRVGDFRPDRADVTTESAETFRLRAVLAEK